MPAEARAGRLSSDYTSGLAGMSAEEAARRARLNSGLGGARRADPAALRAGPEGRRSRLDDRCRAVDAETLAQSGQLALARAGQPKGGQLLIGDLLTQGGGALAAGCAHAAEDQAEGPELR